MSPTLFISDLHLSAERDDIVQCFLDFMQNDTSDAAALYILGDLFEMWLGDDDQNAFTMKIADCINSVSQRMPVYFIHGNRDFLLASSYAKACNMTLLPEQHVIVINNKRILISHGDELCTRDEAYMKFRKKARSWWWPRLMQALPLSLRRKIGQSGRKKSKLSQQALAKDIMDVTQSEVENTMNRYDTSLFIHGHTHRPAIHQFSLNGKNAQRIVLGDWYYQGSILRVDENAENFELQTIQFGTD